MLPDFCIRDRESLAEIRIETNNFYRGTLAVCVTQVIKTYQNDSKSLNICPNRIKITGGGKLKEYVVLKHFYRLN